MSGRVGRSGRYPPTAWSEAHLYRPFVIAALLAGAGAGVPLGAVAMAAFAAGTSLGKVTGPLLQVHGAVQLLGWAGCFVIGISFHVLPRFRGGAPVWFPWPQRSILALLFGGLIVRAVAQPWPELPLRAPALVASGVAICAAMTIFAATAARILRGGTPQRRPVEHWLWLGVAGAALTGAVSLLMMVDLAARDAVMARPAWNAAFQAAALYGFIIPFAFGISSRAIAGFLGLRPRHARLDAVAWGLLATGSAALVASSAAELTLVAQLARALVAAGCLVFIVGVRLFERPASPPDTSGYPRHRRYVYVAFAWLAVHAALTLTAIARAAVEGRGGSGDAALHLLTLGFVSTLIIGFAARVLPLFEARPLSRRDWRVLDATLWLLGIATAGRLVAALPIALPIALPVVVSDALPPVLGLSAATGLASVLSAAWVLLAMLLGRPATTPPRTLPPLRIAVDEGGDVRAAPGAHARPHPSDDSSQHPE